MPPESPVPGSLVPESPVPVSPITASLGTGSLGTGSLLTAPLQAMDLTTLRAVLAELRPLLLPSRFEKAQQSDGQTLQLGFRSLTGRHWLVPRAPRTRVSGVGGSGGSHSNTRKCQYYHRHL